MAARTREETILFRIPSDPKYVPTIRRAVLSIARSMGFTEQTAADIELSVAEAITNAVEHGSPGHNRNTVAISCKVGEDRLSIEVRDEGLGFDLPEDGECRESMEEHGRGLRLIYKLMDKVNVCHTNRGSRIRMVKKHLDRDSKPNPQRTSAHQDTAAIR